MSYILDALRKADAQRERSRLPGLNDRPPGPDDTGGGGGSSPLLWGVLGVGLVSIGLAAWQLARPAHTTGSTVAQGTPAPSPAPLPVPETVPAVPPAAPAAAPVPATPAARIEPPAPPASPAVAPPVARPAPAAPAARREASAPAAPAPARAAAPASAPATASAAGAPEPTTTIPPGAPKLAITGGVYSQTAAQRMLIVNGQVFTEGSEPAPGVLLEQIRPNQAVLNWRGQRYLVSY